MTSSALGSWLSYSARHFPLVELGLKPNSTTAPLAFITPCWSMLQSEDIRAGQDCWSPPSFGSLFRVVWFMKTRVDGILWALVWSAWLLQS